MWGLEKGLLLVPLGIGIGVVLTRIIDVGREADRHVERIKESKESGDS